MSVTDLILLNDCGIWAVALFLFLPSAVLDGCFAGTQTEPWNKMAEERNGDRDRDAAGMEGGTERQERRKHQPRPCSSCV